LRTHKKIIRIRHVAADAEQLHQVVELAVDIAAYLRWSDQALQPHTPL